MKWDRYSAESLERKFSPFALVVVLIFSVLFIRLWQLQILKGKEYKDLSENNRIRLRKVLPLRGRILDRKGRVLATNRPSFSVTVIPEDVLDVRRLSKRLSSLLGMDAKAISQKITANGRPPFQPVYIKRDISWEELSRVKALLMDMPGVQVVVEPIRTYPYGELAAHLLGYVGEVDRKELAANDGYDVGDVVGKTGVEAVWERYLRGSKGGRQVEVDAFGREVRVLGEVLPIPGWDLYLTIDVELQRRAEELLRDKVGAIVALDPSSGEVLALCSSPSYSPSLFARGISRGRWKRLLDHPLHPLTNRAIQGLYAPGSVFKIVTAAAALQEGRLSPKEKLFCGGSWRLGNRTYRCWREGGHGELSLHRAIVESCDVYFYQVGHRVGIDALSRYAQAFGFGKRTGISLPHEKGGLVPSRKWKREKLGESWWEGETVTLAIGQGYILVTPLQMARMIAAVANGGDLYVPLLAQRVKEAEGERERIYRPQKAGRLPLRPSVLEEIRRALVGVVAEERGTGKAARIEGVRVAGKTGTAQVSKMGEKRLKPEELPYELRDHAWFVAYAPADDPKIAVAVLVEHGGHGGSAAAPLAREVIKKWLEIVEGGG